MGGLGGAAAVHPGLPRPKRCAWADSAPMVAKEVWVRLPVGRCAGAAGLLKIWIIDIHIIEICDIDINVHIYIYTQIDR